MIEPRPIVVISNIIIDDIVLAGGARRSSVLGGAATYSAIGAASWWPQVAIVAGVGGDLDELTGGRLARLGLRDEGLLIRDPHTIRNHLVYLADGERTETPMLGIEHFDKMQTTPDDVPDSLLPAAGTYFFQDVSPDFWRSVARRRAQLGATLWEWQAGGATPSVGDAAPSTGGVTPAAWPSVRALLPTMDMFSLTLSEARDLLGTQEPQDIVSKLLIAGANIVVLRMGAAGAVIADHRHQLRLRPPASRVVDVTGAGNAFCGGFLAGWCGTQDLEWAARAAAAAAAQTMLDYGPPDQIDHESLRALAGATTITLAATTITPVDVIT
ncbi:MAG TPA: carbohydrate kinase family protein [Steroidobacteraceae bacterium]|nr:carbohydrate kinase family protein [Steroidobacteraceae bacterium]